MPESLNWKKVSSALFSFSLFLFTFSTAHADDRHWRGTTSASAADGANWLEATAPTNGVAIILDADSAAAPMTWDLDDVTIASWTQTADYTGTVTFQTGISRSAAAAGAVVMRPAARYRSPRIRSSWAARFPATAAMPRITAVVRAGVSRLS